MKKINLNDFEGEIEFKFGARKLKSDCDKITFEKASIDFCIVSDTKFLIETTDLKTYMFFLEEFKNSFGHREALKYKREYTYKNELFSLEAYGGFVTTISHPDLSWIGDDKNPYEIEIVSDCMKLNVPDIKKFIEEYKMSFSIEARRIKL